MDKKSICSSYGRKGVNNMINITWLQFLTDKKEQSIHKTGTKTSEKIPLIVNKQMKIWGIFCY